MPTQHTYATMAFLPNPDTHIPCTLAYLHTKPACLPPSHLEQPPVFLHFTVGIGRMGFLFGFGWDDLVGQFILWSFLTLPPSSYLLPWLYIPLPAPYFTFDYHTYIPHCAFTTAHTVRLPGTWGYLPPAPATPVPLPVHALPACHCAATCSLAWPSFLPTLPCIHYFAGTRFVPATTACTHFAFYCTCPAACLPPCPLLLVPCLQARGVKHACPSHLAPYTHLPATGRVLPVPHLPLPLRQFTCLQLPVCLLPALATLPYLYTL